VADYMRYTYSSEGQMVSVVCGLIASAGSSLWITESWCADAGAGGFFMAQFVHYPV